MSDKAIIANWKTYNENFSSTVKNLEDILAAYKLQMKETTAAIASVHPLGVLPQIVPALGDPTHIQCPVCQSGHTTTPLNLMIQHVNDVHSWSREKIADWLETLDIDLTVKPLEKEKTANAHASGGTGYAPTGINVQFDGSNWNFIPEPF